MSNLRVCQQVIYIVCHRCCVSEGGNSPHSRRNYHFRRRINSLANVSSLEDKGPFLNIVDDKERDEGYTQKTYTISAEHKQEPCFTQNNYIIELVGLVINSIRQPLTTSLWQSSLASLSFDSHCSFTSSIALSC